MAVIKIPQSQQQVRAAGQSGNVDIRLPLSLAQQQGAALSSLGKVYEDIYKEVMDAKTFLEVAVSALESVNASEISFPNIPTPEITTVLAESSPPETTSTTTPISVCVVARPVNVYDVAPPAVVDATIVSATN